MMCIYRDYYYMNKHYLTCPSSRYSRKTGANRPNDNSASTIPNWYFKPFCSGSILSYQMLFIAWTHDGVAIKDLSSALAATLEKNIKYS